MNTIMKDVTIAQSDRMFIELELPEGFPVGEAVMTLESRSGEEGHVNNAARMCGKGRGRVWMADDFDVPLDDFAEYM